MIHLGKVPNGSSHLRPLLYFMTFHDSHRENVHLQIRWFRHMHIYIYIPGVPIRRFFSGLLLFLVEDQKFLKDTLLVSYCCALVLLFCALVSCFRLCFSTSSLRHVFGRDQKKDIEWRSRYIHIFHTYILYIYNYFVKTSLTAIHTYIKISLENHISGVLQHSHRRNCNCVDGQFSEFLIHIV